MPKISVIVPVYNVEPYLHRCVDSILAQTFTDFELILVDDGSPDNCPSICDEYAKKDNRVVVIHQNNGGLSAARNAGIDWSFANSDSEWITFIDSDDWVHYSYLQKLYTLCVENNTAITICDFRRVSTHNQYELIKTKSITTKSENAYVNYYSLCITACSKLYKKELFKDTRFPVGKLHEDAFVTHLLLFKAKNVSILKEQLYAYYNNLGSITRSSWHPKRLNELEAHETRLKYLYFNNFNASFNRELIAYILCIAYQIKEIERDYNNKRHKKYKNFLTKKLKKTLSFSKAYINIKTNKYSKNEYTLICESAYPKRMHIYWLFKGVSHKIKNILGVIDANN